MAEKDDFTAGRMYGTPGVGKGPVLFRAMTACDCGCGLKNRFEFQVGRDMVSIDDPAAIKALIQEMSRGFQLLFPGVALEDDPRGH